MIIEKFMIQNEYLNRCITYLNNSGVNLDAVTIYELECKKFTTIITGTSAPGSICYKFYPREFKVTKSKFLRFGEHGDYKFSIEKNFPKGFVPLPVAEQFEKHCRDLFRNYCRSTIIDKLVDLEENIILNKNVIIPDYLKDYIDNKIDDAFWEIKKSSNYE